MTGLAEAVERKDWTVVALYLLLGVSRTAEQLPPETLEALIDLLGGDALPGEGNPRGNR